MTNVSTGVCDAASFNVGCRARGHIIFQPILIRRFGSKDSYLRFVCSAAIFTTLRASRSVPGNTYVELGKRERGCAHEGPRAPSTTTETACTAKQPLTAIERHPDPATAEQRRRTRRRDQASRLLADEVVRTRCASISLTWSGPDTGGRFPAATSGLARARRRFHMDAVGPDVVAWE